MLFTSTVFIFLFLPSLLILYYLPILRKSVKYQNIILLIFSLCFYAWGEPIFVFLLLFSILLNYLLTLLMVKVNKKKLLLSIIITLDILFLFVFKYSTFIVSTTLGIFGKTSNFNIALPLGISFFTFQIMSYVFGKR